MGGTDSNCCGSRPGCKSYNIQADEDPDRETIRRKRRTQRTQNLDRSPLLHQQSHSFEIKGNITVSSNLTYDITVTINELKKNSLKNSNVNINNNSYYTENNPPQIQKKQLTTPQIQLQQKQSKQQKQTIPIHIKPSIIDPIINIKNDENKCTNNWIANYNEDNAKDTIRIDEAKEDEDEDMESIISYLSNVDNDEKYDLNEMQTLELGNNNNNNNNTNVRPRRGSNLLNEEDVENWNTNDMDQLEMEMLREMRRMSSPVPNMQQ